MYLICRTQKLPYMLIDFSDVLQVSGYWLSPALVCSHRGDEYGLERGLHVQAVLRVGLGARF